MKTLPLKSVLANFEEALRGMEAEAWTIYLRTTASRQGPKYLRIEEMAWSRLQQKLSRIQEQRAMAQNLTFG
jgi:hypothetical protein